MEWVRRAGCDWTDARGKSVGSTSAPGRGRSCDGLDAIEHDSAAVKQSCRRCARGGHVGLCQRAEPLQRCLQDVHLHASCWMAAIAMRHGTTSEWHVQNRTGSAHFASRQANGYINNGYVPVRTCGRASGASATGLSATVTTKSMQASRPRRAACTPAFRNWNAPVRRRALQSESWCPTTLLTTQRCSA